MRQKNITRQGHRCMNFLHTYSFFLSRSACAHFHYRAFTVPFDSVCAAVKMQQIQISISSIRMNVMRVCVCVPIIFINV